MTMYTFLSYHTGQLYLVHMTKDINKINFMTIHIQKKIIQNHVLCFLINIGVEYNN